VTLHARTAVSCSARTRLACSAGYVKGRAVLRGGLCPQTSCFCAAQFLTAYCWGLASDRIGRKVWPGPRARSACDGMKAARARVSCSCTSCISCTCSQAVEQVGPAMRAEAGAHVQPLQHSVLGLLRPVGLLLVGRLRALRAGLLQLVRPWLLPVQAAGSLSGPGTGDSADCWS
jgi:hypothetical protein